MTDTIILHPNDDGTYHWMCPNCKREDLGLSAETDLTAYCPNVTCPHCGFQFGVDKRYLNELSTSYICGECLVTQRFSGTCGNCGANALRRASMPVPLDMEEKQLKMPSENELIEVGDRVRVEFWQGKDDICGDVVYIPIQIGESWIIRSADRLFYIQRFATISKRLDSHED